MSDYQSIEIVGRFLLQDRERLTFWRLIRALGGMHRVQLILDDVVNFRQPVYVTFVEGPDITTPGRYWSALLHVFDKSRNLLKPGTTFSIKEGYNVVGQGTVIRCLS